MQVRPSPVRIVRQQGPAGLAIVSAENANAAVWTPASAWVAGFSLLTHHFYRLSAWLHHALAHTVPGHPGGFVRLCNAAHTVDSHLQSALSEELRCLLKLQLDLFQEIPETPWKTPMLRLAICLNTHFGVVKGKPVCKVGCLLPYWRHSLQ